VTTTNAKKPAFYTFTVTPINDAGDGAVGTKQIEARRT
jgi:hypothetical protein